MDNSVTNRNIISLLEQTDLRATRYDVCAPMACHDAKMIIGTLFIDESHYWRIEGRDTKYKSLEEALYELALQTEIQRQKMMEEEFGNFS